MTIEHHPCAAACVIRGHHTTTCDGTCHGCHNNNGHRTHCDRTCHGCLPRPAEYGHLCPWCWQQLHADLIDAPALIDHLRDVAHPHASAKPLTDHHTRTDPAEGNLLSAAIDAADELHAHIASWAQLILEEHPAGLTGPTRDGWWISHGRHDTDPETGEPYTSEPRTVGIKDTTGRATQRLVTWLLPHLDWASRQDWAGTMRTELRDTTATTRARWPQAERPHRHVRGVPCSRCDHLTLNYSPPAAYRHPFTVTCTNPDCGRVFTEAEWDAHLAKYTLRKRGHVA